MRIRDIVALGLVICLATACQGASSGASGKGCDEGDPFKIGVVLPLSGATAEGGKQTVAGIDIAAADLNAKGGLLGRCVEVVKKDVQSDATKALQMTRALVQRDQVEFVVGAIDSSMIFPVSSVTGRAKKILVVGATDAIDYEKNPYVFRTEVSVSQIGGKYVDYMKNTLGLKRFGVLAVNNAYGKGVTNAVKKSAADDGLTITRTEMFDPAALNLRTQVQAIKDSGAQGLVTVVYGQAAIVALKARAEIGWQAPIFGSNGFATKDVAEGAGAKAMKGLLVSPTYKRLNHAAGQSDVTDPTVTAFRGKLAKDLKVATMNDLIQQYAAGYDMVGTVADAVKATKSDDSDEIKAYMESHPHKGIRGTYEFSARDHDGVPDDAVGMAVASSLRNGVLESAKGEK